VDCEKLLEERPICEYSHGIVEEVKEVVRG